MSKLYPKCFYELVPPYVDVQGYVSPCCWLIGERDNETKKYFPHANGHEEKLKPFHLDRQPFEATMLDPEWKELKNQLHSPDGAFRACHKVCSDEKTMAGITTFTTYADYLKNLNLELHIEPSTRCTLACSKCPRTHGAGYYPVMDMSLDHIRDLADQKIYERILLCGGFGDPIYHRQFMEMVRIFRDGGKYVKVVTAGSHRSQKWWNELADVINEKPDGKMGFSFSIDGLEDTNHIYRKNSNWDSIMTGLDTMRALDNTHVTIKFIVFKHNEHQIDDMKAFAKDKGVGLSIAKSSRYDGEDDPLRPSEEYVNNG